MSFFFPFIILPFFAQFLAPLCHTFSGFSSQPRTAQNAHLGRQMFHVLVATHKTRELTHFIGQASVGKNWHNKLPSAARFSFFFLSFFKGGLSN